MSYQTPFICPLSPLLPQIPLHHFHTEQSACHFILPAVSPHTLLHMIRPHSASHHFLSLRIPLYFPRTRYRILREKRKKDALSVSFSPAESTTDKTVIPQKQTQPYPPSCKQTKRPGELTKKTNSQTKSNTQRGTRAKCGLTDFPSVSRKRKG